MTAAQRLANIAFRGQVREWEWQWERGWEREWDSFVAWPPLAETGGTPERSAGSTGEGRDVSGTRDNVEMEAFTEAHMAVGNHGCFV